MNRSCSVMEQMNLVHFLPIFVEYFYKIFQCENPNRGERLKILSRDPFNVMPNQVDDTEYDYLPGGDFSWHKLLSVCFHELLDSK